jgi:hypothetical protein
MIAAKIRFVKFGWPGRRLADATGVLFAISEINKLKES